MFTCWIPDREVGLLRSYIVYSHVHDLDSIEKVLVALAEVFLLQWHKIFSGC